MPLLAFTHTLLHRHFLYHAAVDPDRIALVIASNLPLYSVLPFQIMTDNIGMLNRIEQTIDRALKVARWLDATSDWQLAPPLLAAAEALERVGRNEWSGDRRQEIRIRIMICELRILRRHRQGARGDYEWTEHIIADMLGGDVDKLDAPERLLRELGRGELRSAVDAILSDDDNPEELKRLILAAAGSMVPGSNPTSDAIASLDIPIMTRGSMGAVYAVIDLVALLQPEYRTAELDSAIGDALRRTLQRLSERGLHGYMQAPIERGRHYLPEEEVARWEERRLSLADQGESTAAPHEGKLKISMVGSVNLQHSGAEPVRVRGARLRTMLGLLVADRMLERPLSYREFCRIAADGEIDQEKARKVMNMGVLRLREIVGADAVLTDSVTPQLNVEKVQVDLLEAHELLRRAIEAMKEGSLARAEEILRCGFDTMPGDEEIAELLCETLVSLGKRMEAERVRMRVMDE